MLVTTSDHGHQQTCARGKEAAMICDHGSCQDFKIAAHGWSASAHQFCLKNPKGGNAHLMLLQALIQFVHPVQKRINHLHISSSHNAPRKVFASDEALCRMHASSLSSSTEVINDMVGCLSCAKPWSFRKGNGCRRYSPYTNIDHAEVMTLASTERTCMQQFSRTACSIANINCRMLFHRTAVN